MDFKRIINGIYAAGIVGALLFTPACSDMNELSDRFLDQGETIYAAMVDTVEFGSGKGRVKLISEIKTNRVKTLRIYWNDKADSLDIEVDNRAGSYETMIENLAERSYIFNLVSFDKYGNRSLEYEVFGQALGENYRSSLLNRGIASISANNKGEKMVIWGNIDTLTNKPSHGEMVYTNAAGEEITVEIPLKETQTVIPSKKQGTPVKCRTVYYPDELAVDRFDTDYRQFETDGSYPLLKTGWAVVDKSSEHDAGNNAAKNAIDGNINTRWHTKAADEFNYPHNIVIDLGGMVTICKFAVCGTTFEQTDGGIDKRLPTRVKFEVSTNNQAWTDCGEYDLNNEKGGQQFIEVEPVDARYFRFTGLEGSDKNMVVGELDVFVAE